MMPVAKEEHPVRGFTRGSGRYLGNSRLNQCIEGQGLGADRFIHCRRPERYPRRAGRSDYRIAPSAESGSR